MVREIRCTVCGGEKPLFRLKYCDKCALQTKLKQSRDKKREYRQRWKDYHRGERLAYKKAWRQRRGWNDYMRKYRGRSIERIREQNRAAWRRYRERASLKRNEYMRDYRARNAERIREQNRAAARRYRQRASVTK
ncbi:hypothetical protein LR007_03545 [candidate division NPL-UPA2 bacterium]|nr:hypothetical protein [candidate division NPL-UPA2 bacterium]